MTSPPTRPLRVLVTGASRGIGRAIADRYRAERYEVIVPPRAELDLEDAAAVEVWAADPAHLAVDVLVNNAGINVPAPIAELDRAAWDRVLAVNLTAPFLLLRGVAPQMAARGWGRVVNIGSAYGLIARAGRAAYGASKAGLLALTRVAALEYASAGVLVNAVVPGFVDTELTRRNNPPAVLAELIERVPLGRLGSEAEVAELVFWLGSPANTYVTGQAVAVDGGFLAA